METELHIDRDRDRGWEPNAPRSELAKSILAPASGWTSSTLRSSTAGSSLAEQLAGRCLGKSCPDGKFSCKMSFRADKLTRQIIMLTGCMDPIPITE